MQDRWESLAALWPLGSPPAALPIPGNQGTPPWSRLNSAAHPEPRELLVWWEGTAERVRAEQVPPTSDSLDKSQTPEQAALVQFLSV